MREQGAKARSERRIRVVVAPHNFEIGGSQINALELAAEVAKDSRYEIVLYAPDGELAERARSLGLELHLSVLRESAPSPRRIREIAVLTRQGRADLVHTYEWAPTIDAAYGAAWLHGVPLISTVLSMDYPYFIPMNIPLVLGTAELRDQATREGRVAHLLEPPVDTIAFSESAVPPGEVMFARSECGADESDCLIVVVGRLAALLKLDGLLSLVRAVGGLASGEKVKLAIVGDGPERGRLEQAAAEVNKTVGRDVVTLLGAKHEPRPYYLAADVVVGMGSSALRAMSLSRPLLVQGEQGFWAVADQHTLPMFLNQGWFGVGDGEGSVERCTVELERLIRASPGERAELGRFGRELVVERYSLAQAAAQLKEFYDQARSAQAPSMSQRVLAPIALTFEIVKLRTAIRFPQLQNAFRRLTKR